MMRLIFWHQVGFFAPRELELSVGRHVFVLALIARGYDSAVQGISEGNQPSPAMHF